MVDLIKRDPFWGNMFWPKWMEDFDDTNKGLKIHETDKDIVAEAVVAGVPVDNVEVHIENGVLTIKAERTEEKKGKNEYKASSRRYYYTAAFSGGAWDKAKAGIEDGVVTVTIPKAEAARPRKIRVSAKKSG